MSGGWIAVFEIIGWVIALSICASFWLMLTAKEGWEDSEGFHFGPHPDDEERDECRRMHRPDMGH